MQSFTLKAFLGAVLLSAVLALSIYDIPLMDASGEEQRISPEKTVVLVVNTASYCGFTPQYQELEELHRTYGERGLGIVAFPCNQFGEQEPGDNQQIQEFVSSNYELTYPVAAKVDVSGEYEHPIFTFVKERAAVTAGEERPREVTWNFNKFLLMRGGEYVFHYAHDVSPFDLEEDIVRALEEVEAQYAAAEEGEEGQQIEGEQMEGQGEEAEL